MPRTVRISEAALRWIEHEAERIAETFGVPAAKAFRTRIDTAVQNLAAFPHLTKRGLIPGTRTLTVYGRTVLTVVERDGDLVIAAARSHWQYDAHAPAETDPFDLGVAGGESPLLELLPWDERGLDLLWRMNTPGQKRHLGGPESEAKVRDRQARYLTYHQPGATEMLMIAADGEVVGSVGYWRTEMHGADAYECGWELVEAVHGRGLGTRATALLLARLRPVATLDSVYAFPTPDNPGSNGICRRLGFELLGVEDFEYPKGVVSPHNVWRLDLTQLPPGA